MSAAVVLRCLVLASTLLSCAALAAADTRYALADRGFVVLTVPTGWVDRVHQTDPNLPPTIVFRPASGADFHVLVTPIWPPRPDMPPSTAEDVHALVKGNAEQMQGQAVEREISVRNLTGPEVFGSLFSATDPNPKPGEYKLLTQGMLALAELRVTFTILTNDGQDAVVASALDMLKAIRREPRAAKAP